MTEGSVSMVRSRLIQELNKELKDYLIFSKLTAEYLEERLSDTNLKQLVLELKLGAAESLNLIDGLMLASGYANGQLKFEFEPLNLSGLELPIKLPAHKHQIVANRLLIPAY